ncbi:AAA family ATPase, partial [Streptococcus suis]
KNRKKLVKACSLGMKQRLALAFALVKEPQILLLDEPTNGLDPSGIHEIRELIIRLAKEAGLTIFISSHILSEIEQIADRVGIINHGRLVYEGEIE